MNPVEKDNDPPAPRASLPELTCQIVCAYLRHNTLPASEIPNLLAAVHAALCACRAPNSGAGSGTLTPAVPVRKSVRADFLICLEDGCKRKALTRYLRARYDMSPDEYRKKWRLAPDYPMVAPRYAAKRSVLAKRHGLGRKSGPSRGQATAP